MNTKYYKIITFSVLVIISTNISPVNFHKSKETLNKISFIIQKKQKGCYLRFGDGDINLAIGSNDLLQKANTYLQKEMREAFAINGENVLKTIPLYCKEFGGYEPHMSPGNHEAPYQWCLNIYNKALPLWNGPITDVYSHVALHYLASYDQNYAIDFLSRLKKYNCVVVANQNVPQSILTLLFGQNHIFIATPPTQSYSEINRIEGECLQAINLSNEYKIIVTAMGCSGRALQKRLWYKCDNCFLFDFGSLLDALCGWNTRAWIQLSNFQANNFLNKLSIYSIS